MNANGSAEGSHVVRHVPEHPLSRILPPSRFPEVRIPGLMAHSPVLRETPCAVPPCACNTAEETVLGSYSLHRTSSVAICTRLSRNSQPISCDDVEIVQFVDTHPYHSFGYRGLPLLYNLLRTERIARLRGLGQRRRIETSATAARQTTRGLCITSTSELQE